MSSLKVAEYLVPHLCLWCCFLAYGNRWENSCGFGGLYCSILLSDRGIGIKLPLISSGPPVDDICEPAWLLLDHLSYGFGMVSKTDTQLPKKYFINGLWLKFAFSCLASPVTWVLPNDCCVCVYLPLTGSYAVMLLIAVRPIRSADIW